MVVDVKKKFVIILPPKTASTSIRAALREDNLEKFLPGTYQHLNIRFPEVGKDFLVAGVVRNPYDRWMSQWIQSHKQVEKKGWSIPEFRSVKDFVKWCRSPRAPWVYRFTLTDYYSNAVPLGSKEEVLEPDFLIRFEELEESINRLPFIKDLKLPHKNKGLQISRKLEPEHIDAFNAVCKEDCERFGYDYLG